MENVARATSPVVIGRDEELSRLVRALDAVEVDGTAIVLVAGEAGVGKTRLVAALATEARRRNVRVATADCIDLGDTTSPLAPVRDLIAGLLDRLDDEAVDLVLGPARGVGEAVARTGRRPPGFAGNVERAAVRARHRRARPVHSASATARRRRRPPLGRCNHEDDAEGAESHPSDTAAAARRDVPRRRAAPPPPAASAARRARTSPQLRTDHRSPAGSMGDRPAR